MSKIRKEVQGRLQHKHNTEAGWILSVYTDSAMSEMREKPFIPLNGEFIVYDPDEVFDYKRFKNGDGIHNVVELPFVFEKVNVTKDWNQNDETAADYIKNRTHYEEPPTNREDVILDKSYTFEEIRTEDGGIGEFKYPLVKDWSKIITIGSKLTVTIQGETHEAIFTDSRYSVDLPGLVAGSPFDSPEHYPTMYFEEDGINLFFGLNAGGWSMDIGPLTISTSKEAIVHQLDEKYIPSSIARVNELPNIGINTSIEGEGASAFGIESIARGDATHAEGYQVLAGSKSFKFNLEHEYTEDDTNEGWYYLTSVEGINQLVNQTEIEENITIDINTIGEYYLESPRQNPDAWIFDHSKDEAIYDGRLTINNKVPYIFYIRGTDLLNGYDAGSEQFFKPTIQDDGIIYLEYFGFYNNQLNSDGINNNIVYRVDEIKTFDNPEYSMRLENNYDFNGQVIEVDETLIRVKVTNYKKPVVGTATEIGEWSFFFLPEYPNIGTENVIGYGAHAEGYGTIAHGTGAHAEGWATLAAGRYSHAEGRQTKAGYAAHAEGRETEAKGENTHAEGVWTRAIGNYSHAEGKGTEAIGGCSHVEGEETKAIGSCSHAEGRTTTASGINSHAEGGSTVASGQGAHAEGTTTSASGPNAHSEGNSTKAIGESSHAEGGYSEARAKRSHAEGSTVAASDFQHTQGKYNKIDNKGIYADIIGNGVGSSDSQRANAHTVDWKGNAWYSGQVYVGGSYAYDDGTGIKTDGKRLATIDEVGYARQVFFMPNDNNEIALFRFDSSKQTLTIRPVRFLIPQLVNLTSAVVLSYADMGYNPLFLIFDYAYDKKNLSSCLRIIKRDELKNLTTNYGVIMSFNTQKLTNPESISYKGTYSVNGTLYNESFTSDGIMSTIESTIDERLASYSTCEVIAVPFDEIDSFGGEECSIGVNTVFIPNITALKSAFKNNLEARIIKDSNSTKTAYIINYNQNEDIIEILTTCTTQSGYADYLVYENLIHAYINFEYEGCSVGRLINAGDLYWVQDRLTMAEDNIETLQSQMGDIETALDAIIEIQGNLIGE